VLEVHVAQCGALAYHVPGHGFHPKDCKTTTNTQESQKRKKRVDQKLHSMCIHTFELMEIPHYKLKIF
jgi:hypothetical protein